MNPWESLRPSFGVGQGASGTQKGAGKGQGGSQTDPEGPWDSSGKVQSGLWSAKGGLLVAPDGAWAGLGYSTGCCRVLQDAPRVQYADP